jgi:hypothetical protein
VLCAWRCDGYPGRHGQVEYQELEDCNRSMGTGAHVRLIQIAWPIEAKEPGPLRLQLTATHLPFEAFEIRCDELIRRL